MFAFLIFLIILSVMILVHEFGHFSLARKVGVRVERFALGFGPKLLSYKKNGTEYALCLFAFGGYVKMAGDNWQDCKGQKYEFLAQAPLNRAKIIFAGPALNYALAFLCFWVVNVIGYPNLTTKVGEIMTGYPAESAGILKGDKIKTIDGQEVKYWQELQEIVRRKQEPKVELEILRGENNVKLSVGLRQEDVKNILGMTERVSLIGIKPEGESVLVKHNIFQAFVAAGKNIWNLTILTYMSLGRMLIGGISFRESVTGPLGMFYITSEAISLGLSAVLYLMAVLSASLAIFNLLPLPVLDGGHILFLGLEKLRGRHLSERTEDRIAQAGMAFIISLALFVFFNDCVKFGVWEKISAVFSKFVK